MTERPILFSDAMVRAILDGTKTQTRRPVSPQPYMDSDGHWSKPYCRGIGLEAKCRDTTIISTGETTREWIGLPELFDHLWTWPYGVGDRLWVRECWAETSDIDGRRVMAYRAGGTRLIVDGPNVDHVPHVEHGEHRCTALVTRWRPSIHMPRWASRLILEITGARVERLQDITEEDAIAEGVDAVAVADVPRQAVWTRRQDFAQLWDRTYKWNNWNVNPWVRVIEFQVTDAR